MSAFAWGLCVKNVMLRFLGIFEGKPPFLLGFCSFAVVIVVNPKLYRKAFS